MQKTAAQILANTPYFHTKEGKRVLKTFRKNALRAWDQRGVEFGDDCLKKPRRKWWKWC